MSLVTQVRWNFPGLETQEKLNEHRATVLKFMGKKQAKVIAPCYSECANFSLLLGETDKVEPYMRRAYKAAMLFDSAPTCKMENIKFCLGDIQNATTYDDLGESATAAVVKQITQESRNEQLWTIWKKIAQESCGGAE